MNKRIANLPKCEIKAIRKNENMIRCFSAFLQPLKKSLSDFKQQAPDIRVVTRTLIGGGGGGINIHTFMFCLTNFFSSQIQIRQFENKSVGQNMSI